MVVWLMVRGEEVDHAVDELFWDRVMIRILEDWYFIVCSENFCEGLNGDISLT